MPRNRLLAVLIVLATAAFALGVGLEKSETHEEPATETAHIEGAEGEAGEEVHSEEGEAHEETGEEVLGIDLESTPLVILAVVGSLALAAGVWLRPDLRVLLLIVFVAMLAFAVLDVREVFHQVDESNEGIAALAVAVALLHLAAAGLALSTERRALQSAA